MSRSLCVILVAVAILGLAAMACSDTGGITGGSPTSTPQSAKPDCGDGWTWKDSMCKKITYTADAPVQPVVKPTRTLFELTKCLASGEANAKCLTQ